MKSHTFSMALMVRNYDKVVAFYTQNWVFSCWKIRMRVGTEYACYEKEYRPGREPGQE